MHNLFSPPNYVSIVDINNLI